MVNLLSANFLRLKKSVLFWGTLAISFGFGVLLALDYYQMTQYESVSLDGAFFTYPILTAIFTAVFIPLFFGVEYSNHTIRGKVVIGHSRLAIYAANLIVGTTAAFLFCAAYMAAVIVVGMPLIGPIEMDPKLAVFIILGSLMTMAAFCALFTLITMLCSRKSLSSAACVLGVFLLLITSIFMKSRLDAPEYYTDYSLSADGTAVWGDLIVNPQYMSGTQRTVFESLYNLLPSGQAIQYSSQQTQNLDTMPLYALTIIILSTGLGLSLFQRKDLK